MTDEELKDHQRGCAGRDYTCTCGYDDTREHRIERLTAENEWLRLKLEQASNNLKAIVSSTYYAPREAPAVSEEKQP